MSETRQIELAASRRPIPYLPGDGAMWFFVLGDMIIFASYFVAFMIFRAREVNAFTAAQQNLYLDMGVVNTLLLLFSSWIAAQAVLAARAGDAERTTRLLTATATCGAIFIVLKLCEWWLEISAGHTFSGGTFMAFYYVLTGVHMLHVVMGLIILTVVVVYVRTNPIRSQVVEQATTYWHMVDLLWVIIFALLYVMR
ncbi:cytochrome c oxidase subunit 3 [Mycobacterium conspicuum]|uniref:Probable cytochrome c oxidase subunit 3 n=1 Tax=Mycobacterium conspicuum TaxID=44010 RepID=A0A7I7YG37_9MYCO|nr:cytochrome c oxidase subunit 3 [Mycobacterium conspicuum]BBZ39953.1 cytochrome c oxidase subunit III [Mycobacterium conspicuum]